MNVRIALDRSTLRRILIGSVLVSAATAVATVPAHGEPAVRSRPATLFMEQMSWTEVRDAIAGGAKTVILAAGAVEQSGPYLPTAKHILVLRVTLPLIARKLGNTLIAPIVPFGPADTPDDDHYAGSIDISEETFRKLLLDITDNLRKSGFERILLIGDSYGNQRSMAWVAQRRARDWKGGSTRVVNVSEYYDNPRWESWLKARGIHEVSEGIHDDVRNSALLAVYDPQTIRMTERRQAGKFSINGVSLDPLEHTLAIGNELAEYQAETAVAAIRSKLAAQPLRGAGSP